MSFTDKEFDEFIAECLKIELDEEGNMKDKKKAEIQHRLVIGLQIPEDVELGDKPISVQVLKEGKFRHPWWGVLRFDSNFFQTIINNFSSDIPQEKIAFDFKHNPDWGAAAWISKLYQTGSALMADVELTKKGKQSIKEKEFMYFSAEYTDDYVEYEFEEEDDGNGNTVTKETKISHGPTLLGGGLTNRPFIKGMKPISFSLSEDGKVIEMEEITDPPDKNNKKPEEVNEDMKKELEALKKEKETLETQIKELEANAEKKSAEEIKKEVKDAQKKLADISKEIEKANKAESKALEDLKTENTEKEKKLAEMQETVTALGETVKGLMKDREASKKREHVSSVKETIRELEDMKMFPSTLEVVKKYLSADSGAVIVTLSEGENDKKVEVKKILADVIKDVLESIPKEHRFDDGEKTESITGPDKDKELSVKEVDEYAEKHKLSYAEALIVLNKENKI